MPRATRPLEPRRLPTSDSDAMRTVLTSFLSMRPRWRNHTIEHSGDAFHDLSHYHNHSPPTPMPTAAALLSADRREGAKPATGARHLLIAILASCAAPERLRVADETWCSLRHRGVRCWAYLDCESPPTPTSSIRSVPASRYVVPWHAPLASGCCDPLTDHRTAAWDGRGASTYYCNSTDDKYAADTALRLAALPAQYRVLPALQHATALALGRDETRWLVAVRDDSWVGLPRLLHVLSEHNHKVPMQLGDFVPAVLLNGTHWRRPYACVGAGVVLSRAALERLRWTECMQSHAGSCMQADWMVGRCLEAVDVTAVAQRGCGTCAAGAGFEASPHAEELRTSLLSRRCAFAQFPPDDEAFATLFGQAERRKYLLYALATPAVSHGLHGAVSRYLHSQLWSRPHCIAPPSPPSPSSSPTTAHCAEWTRRHRLSTPGRAASRASNTHRCHHQHQTRA